MSAFSDFAKGDRVRHASEQLDTGTVTHKTDDHVTVMYDSGGGGYYPRAWFLKYGHRLKLIGRAELVQ